MKNGDDGVEEKMEKEEARREILILKETGGCKPTSRVKSSTEKEEGTNSIQLEGLD